MLNTSARGGTLIPCFGFSQLVGSLQYLYFLLTFY